VFKWLENLVDSNDKELKRIHPVICKINDLETEFIKLSDAELRAKTDEFKALLKEGASLEKLLPEAFAAVREAARRTIGQRHFDVQLIGGTVLHQGKIAEMKTGEGKTLVATLPLYLNALEGKGCHLATVNDYLARRDAYWMAPVFHALGISVASIYPMQAPDEHSPARLYDSSHDSGDKVWPHFRKITRQEAYKADILYGTSSEFGFDYLRDNMVVELKQRVQAPLNYAIVDEIDNLLIDEARTPLIISGPAEDTGEIYQLFARLIPSLSPETDYVIDEKYKSVNLTDEGMTRMENILKRDGVLKSPNLYDAANHAVTHHLDSALKAHVLYKIDRDYVVQNGEVVIVDEFTGRLMLGRRYSEGLHQAIEAKENVKVQRENLTYATITIQNYFRMYNKLGGMTGTALTEAEEFHKIYKLEVVGIPTNRPMVRKDFTDLIYKDEAGKFKAVAAEIEKHYQEGLPVLVGTVSIEKSELLSNLLTRRGIPHQILNAKQHMKEAAIIADAGKPGAVTVATNMAGRGVDIILGGKPPDLNPEFKDKKDSPGWQEWDTNCREWQKLHDQVIAMGGLHVVGTERHEARRIDNQLRGRAGRQGDPGSTRFFVSLEDDVVKRFGGDRIKGFMEWAGMDDDTPIENSLVSKTIENAQVRIEGYHFDIRKHLVEYDDVVNKQREIIYAERSKILGGSDLKANILQMIRDEIKGICNTHSDSSKEPALDVPSVVRDLNSIFPVPPELSLEALEKMSTSEVEDSLLNAAETVYEQHEVALGADMRLVERLIMLRIIDTLWIEHLTMMESVRQGIGLESAGQRDPLVAYKRRGHEYFETLTAAIQHEVVHTIYHVSIKREDPPPQPQSPMAKMAAPKAPANKPVAKVAGHKVGRNDPCPCGSGKKYKHCCGK
jgi:preprotein translocase subunit SecA